MKKILKLNKNYCPIDVSEWKDVIIGIFSGALIPIRVAKDEDGKLSDFTLVKDVKEWVMLTPREGEESIGTPNGSFVAPLVVICRNYSKLPSRRVLFPTKRNIWARDKNICGYTGKVLKKTELSIDHIIPSSRGGKNTWENLVTCDRLLNSDKGDRTPEEAGLKLIIKPTRPKNGLICNELYEEWESLVSG